MDIKKENVTNDLEGQELSDDCLGGVAAGAGNVIRNWSSGGTYGYLCPCDKCGEDTSWSRIGDTLVRCDKCGNVISRSTFEKNKIRRR